MKKLVFVSIVFFGVSVLSGDVWSAPRNQSVAQNSQDTQSQKKKVKQSNRKARKQNNRKSQKAKNNEDRAPEKDDTKTEINLESNELYILKLFVDSVLERDIRAVITNMNLLARNLSFRRNGKDKEGDLTVREIVDILKQASSCFDELLRVRSSLYAELFNQVEPKSKLPETTDLKNIRRNLNFIDTEKLSELIAKAEKRSISSRVIKNLKTFSEKKQKAESFIDEMIQKFTKGIISKVEGIPTLDNLSDLNTLSNNNLLKIRERVAPGKIFDNDVDNKLWEEVEKELASADDDDENDEEEDEEESEEEEE